MNKSQNIPVKSDEFSSYTMPFVGAPSGLTSDGDVPASSAFLIVWRRKLLVLAISGIMIALSAFLVFQLPPYYKSTATLLIELAALAALGAIRLRRDPASRHGGD